MPNSQDHALPLLTALLCISVPFFMCLSAILIASYLRYRKRSKQFEHESSEKIRHLENMLTELKRDALKTLCSEWIKRAGNYQNEIEVEIKFIFPLLWFLGYDNDDFQVRVPLVVQLGHQQIRAEADWVVFDRKNKDQPKAIAVIEAKGPEQRLDVAVQEQARSYAFALRAPLYVLANGYDLKVFRRGVQDDTCLLDCTIQNLITSWNVLERILGKRSLRVSEPIQQDTLNTER